MMKLIYNGVNIADAVSIKNAEATDNEGGIADSVTVRFTDVEALWPRWRPAHDDEMRLIEGQYDSGVMYVDRIDLSPNECELTAVSIPPHVRAQTWQAWEQITLKKLIAEIGKRRGMLVSMYDVPDVTYSRLGQNGQNDISWLAYRCMLEGCALKVRNGMFIAYDQRTREGSAAVKTLDLEHATRYKYEDRAADRLSSYAVMSGTRYAICYDKSGQVCRGGARAERQLAAYSTGEAARYARGLLRDCNKSACILRVSVELDGVYAAGETIEVIGNRMINGIWFISSVQYDFTRGLALLNLRRCLDW